MAILWLLGAFFSLIAVYLGAAVLLSDFAVALWSLPVGLALIVLSVAVGRKRGSPVYYGLKELWDQLLVLRSANASKR